MITEEKGTKYVLEGDNGETLIIDFNIIAEDQVLLMLLDRIEYLIETDPTKNYEQQMFHGIGHTLDYHFRRLRYKNKK